VQAILKARAGLDPKPEPARTNTLQKAVLNEIDAAQGTISTTLAVDGRFPARWLTSVLDNTNAKVVLNEAYLENKKPPLEAILKNPDVANQRFVLKSAEAANQRFVLKSAEAANQPFSVLVESVLQKDAKLENVSVAKEAKITINGKPAKLADLKQDMVIALELAVEGNRLVVRSIQAEK